MDEFTLQIELGNAAMNTLDDVAAALRKVADELENGISGSGVIADTNGNTVGSYTGDMNN